MRIRFVSYLLFICCVLSAQEPGTDSAVLRMADFVKAYNSFGLFNPQEKVYLHFDNTGYYLGETIWFKAYVTTAPQLRATELSRVLYVELLTPEGRIVETKKLKIVDGECHGEFHLTNATYFAGFYEVRAYTRVMLNWGDDVVFSRVFPVFDRPDNDKFVQKMTTRVKSKAVPDYRPKAPKANTLNVDFYPEGGDCVKGIPTVIAFKSTDKEGKSCPIEGAVYDREGNAVAEIATQHQGMGKFLLVPDDEYEARINYQNRVYTYKLPKAKNRGYALTVAQTGDKMRVQVRRTPDTEGGLAGIVVCCRGVAHGFEIADLRERTEVLATFDKRDFPDGVQQVTLFNERGEILAERLAFHNSGKHRYTIGANAAKNSYAPFEKIELDMQVSDAEGAPAQASFSLAVHDYDREVPTYYEETILSNLLLESDLRGYIENIAYYFESDDHRHRDALDLLMLVQGWRRYAWKQQAGLEPFTPEHFVEEGLLVKGQVLEYKITGSKPKPDVELSVFLAPPYKSDGTVRTDKEGKFVFLSEMDIWGRVEMMLRSRTADKSGQQKDREYMIELDRVFAPNATAYTPFDTSLPDSNLHAVLFAEYIPEADSVAGSAFDDEQIHYLDEVSVGAKRHISDRPSIVYDVSEEEDKLIDSHITEYTDDIPSLLQQINPYFVITETDEKESYTYKNRPVKFVFYDSGQYLSPGDAAIVAGIDFQTDVETADTDASESDDTGSSTPETEAYEPSVKEFSIDDIKKMEIVENTQSVIIKLYGYPFSERKIHRKGIRTTTLQGYSVPQEFFTPDYSAMLPDAKDYRRTLYWNPKVETDAEGRARISFYNNAFETRLHISAEGLTPDGIPCLYK